MNTQDLISRVESTLQKYRMIRSGEKLLVACSGGADSVALFHILKNLAPCLQIKLCLVHFDHALRRGSEKDLEFTRSLARKFGVPFYGSRQKSSGLHLDKGLSPEERAREWRYRFFESMARKTRIQKIALGHHKDDQAETVLMRLIQGTGIRGLQGIRPMVKRDKLVFIRPLIETRRNEIRHFLKQRSIPYREDPSNQSVHFLRNRIRVHLLPLLEKQFNPRIREALCRLAETAEAESQGFDQWVRQSWKKFLRSRRNGTLQLDRESFLSLPGALQFRLLDQILRVVDSRSGLNYESWRRIETALPKGRLRVTLPRNLDLRLTSKQFFISKTQK